jgi:hypothetical protein
LLALGLVTFLAPQASAGTYTVPGCDGSGRIDGWVAAATPNSGTAYGDGCPGYPYSGGLLARSVGRADTSLAPHGSYASWTFRAPAGTHIAGFATYFRSYAKYPWVPGIRDPDSGRWLNCSLACPMMFPDARSPIVRSF